MTAPPDDEDDADPRALGFAFVPIGVGLGVAVGVALHQLAVGIAVGTALGVALGGALGAFRRTDEPRPD